MRLTWTAVPAHPAVGDASGIAEPESFLVVVRQGDATRVVKVSAPSTGTIVSGLRNGVEASFEVYSVTEAGSSDPAGPVSATPVTGMEGEVAGLIVAFEPGVEVTNGQEAVPGERRVTSVDLTVEGALSDDATLVALSDAVSIDEAEAIASDLAADPAVAWAEPDRFIFTASDPGPIAEPVSVPDDARYAADQWNLWDAYGVGIGDGSTSMTSAWADGTGEGATVAVIDTGITAHPDLDSKVVPGYDFVSDPSPLAAARTERGPPVAFDADAENPDRYGVSGWDDNPTDPGDWRGVAPARNSTWHGTKVAGVIAAQARNRVGVAGVAFGARIQPIRALSWRGGLLSDIAASIIWASGGRVDGVPDNANPSGVINLSLAAETNCPTALQDAIDGARSRGSVVIAAAGNANDDAEKFTPGNCNGVITVAATDRSGNRAPYSNFGPRIDLAAPGGNLAVDDGILTTSNSGSAGPGDATWARDQGTSFAAAHVAAVAAILKGQDASLDPDVIEQRLVGKVRSFAGSTCDADPTRDCGSGILTLAQVAVDACTNTVGSSGGYRMETLTAFFLSGCSGTWTPPTMVTSVDVLAVGGGGGGGAWVGGGGGGGGVTELTGQSVSGGVVVVVGGGGTGAACTGHGTSIATYCTTNNTNNLLSPVATAGGTSSFGAISATGGGAGGSYSAQQPSGSANGGGGGNGAGAAGSVSGSGAQGGKTGGAAYSSSVYFGGGGAGAGANGVDATASGGGTGGSGYTSTITGLVYGGGGGGGAHNSASAASGGSGGGGNGNNYSGGSYNGSSGTSGRGGGGGGGGYPNHGYSSGGNGGQGTVVIRYLEKWTSLSAQPSNYNAGGWVSQAPVVQLVDYNGNSLATSGVTVTASFTSSSGAVTLSNATATTNSSGVATFTSLALSGALGSAGTLTFSASGYGPITSSSVAIVAGPATAAQSLVSASPSSVTANGSSTSTVMVTAKDANGNVVPSQSIFFAIGSGTGTLSAGPWTTNASGVVTATVTSTTAGSVTVHAYLGTSASGTLITQSGSITFTAGAATAVQSTVSASPSSVTADGSSASTVTVTAKDVNGNVVPSQSIFFAIASGTGTLSSGPWTTNASGVATATVTSTTAGSVTVRAYLGTNASGTLITQSGSITFTAGAASKLVVSSIASQVAGTGFDVTVTLTDANGNAVNNTGAQGTVTLTRASGTGTVAGTTTGSIAVGSSAVTISGVTYSKAESGVSLTATGTGSSSLVNGKSGTSNTFTVAAGTATKLVITGSATQTAGTSQDITITAQDANGNTATSYTGDKSLTFSGATSSADGNAPSVVNTSGSIVLFGTATTITFTNGVASVAASKNGVMALYAAESALVSVSDGTILSSGAGRLSVTVSASAASKLAMGTSPVAGASGAVLSTQPAVRILDQYGNLTTSTATVSVSASAGTLGGSEASAGKAAVNGTATFTNLTFTALTSTSATLTFSSGVLAPVTSAAFQATGPGAAATIAVSAGNGQSATAGSAVSTAPAVRVTDAAGNPVSGVSVAFAVATGGGSLASSGTVTTNGSGIATSPAWTLGAAAGSNTLTATSGSLSGSPVTFTATGSAGSVTKLQVLLPGETAAPGTASGKTGTPTAQSAGTSMSVTVNAVDANWNKVTSATPTVAITSSDANANLPGNAALAAGTGTFAVTFRTAGSATVTATDQAGTPLTSGTSASVTVNAGAATKLQVLMPGETTAPGTSTGKTGTPNAQTAGTAFNVTVNAVDANWNVVSSATPTVTFTSSDGSATLPSATALVAGTKSVQVTLKTSGSQTVTATDQSAALTAGTSATTTVNPSASTAAQSTVSASPSSVTADGSSASTVTVTAKDAFGNVVPSQSLFFAIASGTGTLSAGPWTTNASGVATATVTSTTAGSVAVRAYLGTSASGTLITQTGSVTFMAGAATAAQSTVSLSPSSVTADGSTASTVTVTAKDANGNVVPSQSVFFAITSGTGTLSPGPWTTPASGVATATVTSTTAGSVTVRAYLGTSASGTLIAQSGSITFTAGAATKFVLTGSRSQAAGASQNLTITAQDANGNTATSYTGDKNVVFSGAVSSANGDAPTVKGKNGSAIAFGTTTVITFTNGIASVGSGANGVMTLYTAESATIAVTQGSIATTGSDRLSVAVSPASLSSFAVTSTSDGAIATQTAGSSFNVRFRALDAYGNTQTAFTGTVDVTSNSTIVSGSGTSSSFTSGVLSSHAITLTGAGSSRTVTVTRTLGGSQTGTSAGFTVSPAAASLTTSTVTASSASITANGSSTSTITVTLKDAYSNALTTSGGTVEVATDLGSVGATTNNGNGTYTATLTSGTTSGTATVSATLAGSPLTSTSTVALVPGAANKIVIVTQPSAGASGASLATQPVVRIADVNGNTVTSSSASVTVAVSGGTLDGTKTLAASSGMVTYAGLSFAGLVGTSYTLTFTSDGLVSATSSSFSPTTAGSAASIAVNAGNAQTTTMDAAVTIAPSVIVRDSGGNPVQGTSVTFTVAAGGGSLASPGSPATVTSNASGIATAPPWTLGTAVGANSLTAASGSLTGSPVTFSATATARPITITADGESITYGATLSPSYTLSSGRLGGSDAISSVTYTYSGTGSTVYGPSTTPPTGGGTYSVQPSAAVLSPGSAANYTIAYQPGTVTIARESQTIAFSTPVDVTYGVAPYALTPTSDSGLAVTLSTNSASVCTVDSSVVTIVGAGTCSLTASQAGNVNYLAATPVTKAFNVAQAAQAALSVTSASSILFGESYTVTAAGGSGTGGLTFLPGTDFPGSAGCSITTGTGVLTYSSAGTCEVKARRAASANYLLVTSSEQVITIARAGQTLAFTSTVPTSPLPGGTYVPVAAALSTVTGSSSGIPATFTASGTCTMSSGTVTFNATGPCTVTANATADTNFAAATAVTQVIAVGSLNQTIRFPQPANVAFGSSGFSAGASATSDLPVTYVLGSGTTNGACAVTTLGAVSVLAVGTCELVASQAGDAAYAAASDVSRAFQVVPALATAPRLTSASASSQAITVGVSPPGFTGGVAVTAYRLVATPTSGGTAVTSTSCTASPCTITGLANGTEYTVTVAAINAAGTGPASSPSTALTPATTAYAVGALSATPGDGTVDLAWIPLTTDQLGGGAFTRYEVSKRVAGSSTWTLVTDALITQSTSSYTVTGLSNGTSYDFQVVAITTANAGEIPGNTARVVQYPSSAPTAPRTPVVLAASATSVQFSWAAPLSDGGSALTDPNYTVTVTSPTAGAAAVTCVPGGAPAGSARTCTSSGLTNGSAYTFTVVATNRMGPSPDASATYDVPSSITTLSSLIVTGADGVPVDLTPSFDPATRVYDATVPYAVDAVTVTPTTTDAAATVTVDGVPVATGSASAPIALAVGPQVIELVVTASDPDYTDSYEVTITRLPAPPSADGSSGAGDAASTEARNARLQPIAAPASVASGSSPGAVLVDGVAVDMSFIRNGTDSGWIVSAPGFGLSVGAVGPTGQPVPLGSTGGLSLPRGGWLEVSGSGYDPKTPLRVFAISMSEPRIGALRERALDGATYVGSLSVGEGGTVSGRLALPAALTPGGFVLQLNGFTTSDEVRSVSMRMDVLAPPAIATTSLRSNTITRSAFFEGGSAELSADGERRVATLAKALPRNAVAVRVSIVAVSVSMGSPEANLSLARDRAVVLVKELRARGVAGEYTVSVSTIFDVDSGEQPADSGLRSPRSGERTTPVVTSSGKPLSTVSISFVTPAEAG